MAALREQMGDQAPVVEAPPPRGMQFGVHLAALALFTLLTVTRALPIVLHPAHAVTPDPIDPVFNSWDLASTAHSVLSWQHGLWSFFDGNSYYPTPHPASYIDAAVGMLPFSLPLYLLLHDPILVLNVLTGLSFILSAYGAFVLGHRLTHSYAAALMAGLSFGFCPYRTEHLGHINLLSTEWLIAAAIALVHAWDDMRRRWWVGAGFLLGLSAVTNLYYLAYLTGPLLVVAMVRYRDWTTRRLQGALLASAIAACLVVPFMMPYLLRHADIGAAYGTAASTDILSFLQILPGRPLDDPLLPTVPLEMMQPNHGFFPGIVPLVLVVIAVRRRKAIPWLIFAAACAVLALGPRLDIHGRELPIPLPYAALSAYVPHFNLFRDPTRAIMGASLGFAIAAAYGMAELLRMQGQRGRRVALGCILLSVSALELWSPVPTQPIPAIAAGEYWLARQPGIRVVLELPVANAAPVDWARQSEILYDSTLHWKLLINGTGSAQPAGLARTQAILSSYPSRQALAQLHRLRVDVVVLRLAWMTPQQREAAQRACHTIYRDAQEQMCLVAGSQSGPPSRRQIRGTPRRLLNQSQGRYRPAMPDPPRLWLNACSARTSIQSAPSCAGRSRSVGKGEDAGPLDLAVLQLARRRHPVLGQQGQALAREIGAAGVADQDADAARVGQSQPGQHARGGRLFVADVAGQDQVDVRRIGVEQVAPGEGHAHPVGLRIERHGAGAEWIDIRSQRGGGAGPHGGDGAQARAGGEVQHPLAGDLGGMIQ